MHEPFGEEARDSRTLGERLKDKAQVIAGEVKAVISEDESFRGIPVTWDFNIHDREIHRGSTVHDRGVLIFRIVIAKDDPRRGEVLTEVKRSLATVSDDDFAVEGVEWDETGDKEVRVKISFYPANFSNIEIPKFF